MVKAMVIGGCLVAIMVKTKFPGWLGFPIIIVVLSVIRDLGTSPLAEHFFDRYLINPMVGLAGPSEVSPACLLILINAVAVIIGMMIIIFL